MFNIKSKLTFFVTFLTCWPKSLDIKFHMFAHMLFGVSTLNGIFLRKPPQIQSEL